MFTLQGKHTTAKIFINDIEDECVRQINSLINHEAFTEQVCIMPDTHAGKGSVIGFTMPLGDKVIPNVIGVDIGCGMLMANLGGKIKFSPAEADKLINRNIPMGFSINKSPKISDEDFDGFKKQAYDFINGFYKTFGTSYSHPEFDDNWIESKILQVGIAANVFYNSIGSLGGGNHFIEVGKGDRDYYLTIHSGSRNFGLKVANYWQNKAIQNFSNINEVEYNEQVVRIKKETRNKKNLEKEIKKLHKRSNVGVNRDLAFLEGEDMMGYLIDMCFAQYYASLNRKIMFEQIKKVLDIKEVGEIVESIHNYIDFKDFIIRKGAISSYEGEKMIIPFNMRDGILLCEGKSNVEWNYSAPHGAGRIMSRSKAKKHVQLEEFKKSMKGIYSSSVCASTLDESPFVYKNSKMIEKAIEPTARILDRIKPILNIKAK